MLPEGKYTVVIIPINHGNQINQDNIICTEIVVNQTQCHEGPAPPQAVPPASEALTPPAPERPPVKRSAVPLRRRNASARRLRDRGEAYVTPTTGRLMPERAMGPACGERCRIYCSERFDAERRARLFREFWAIADHEAQWDYIARHIEVEPKVHLTTGRPDSRRAYSRTYFLSVGNRELEQVCKPMFLNTLGITGQWIVTVCKKLNDKGYVTGDGRGRVGHRRKKVIDLI